MNLTIQSKRLETDSRSYNAELLDYFNANWPGLEQFEARFDVLTANWGAIAGVYTEIRTELDSGDITILVDATGHGFVDTLAGLV